MDHHNLEISADDLDDLLESSQEVLNLLMKKFDGKDDRGAWTISHVLMLSLAAFVSIRYAANEKNISNICNECTTTIEEAFRKNGRENE